jgi:phosphoglycolate phosphatase
MRFDSLIFDLDGTLWDATGTYAKAWCHCLLDKKLEKIITPDMLFPVMGMEQSKALAQLLPEVDESMRNLVYSGVAPMINCLIPKVGGNLYEGVKECLPRLAERYRLFIVSNCPSGLIHEFLTWSQLGIYFSGHLSYGDYPEPKSFNIRRIMRKYELKNPVYIGDTDSDRVQAEAAGVPFVFVRYGFGDCQQFYEAFDTFGDLSSYFTQ